ncbi:MAG: S26 family signal peptidase [Chitinophagaceae bacterium]|nr:S26 family signal peptidase [Chitinophagaceae bacterium]
MSSNDILVLILISLLIVLLPAPGLYKLFRKAGIPEWKAWVPFLNTWEIVKAAEIRRHWFFWQFIPIAGWFISIWLLIELVKLFGKFKLYQHAAVVFISFIYFPFLGWSKDEKYYGPSIVKKHKKSATREWIDAAVFAIVAATLIRTFIFEAYTIPTGSMEKTLLVNDFLFVSKLSYGPRIPNTPLAVPFVHHTVPGLKMKSYSEAIKIPYRRWFASPVKRNDVVVFNFPAGDTLTVERDSEDPYYDILRRKEMELYNVYGPQIPNEETRRATSKEQARQSVWEEYTVTTRPVDKRENYIKRCVAIAGDTIVIRDGNLFVNGQPAFVPPYSATDYRVTTNRVIGEDELREAGIALNTDYKSPDFDIIGTNAYLINLTASEVEILKGISGVVSVKREISDIAGVYPYDRKFSWSLDNFGPLWIPKKGVTIPLTPENVALYKRVIFVYENNKWEERDGKIYLNGKEAKDYTFKMNYYWMMGDNRHRSQDSRYWGFVPEDHVVGSAWLIWMSYDSGIRWNRLFKTIK